MVAYVGGASSTATNPVLSVPAGIKAGDLMVLAGRTDGTTVINSPAFTSFASVGSSLNVWTRTSDGTEKTVSITDSGGLFSRLNYTLDVISGGLIVGGALDGQTRAGIILDSASVTAGQVNTFQTASLNAIAGELMLSLVVYNQSVVDGSMYLATGSPLTIKQYADTGKHDLSSAIQVLAASGVAGPYGYTGTGGAGSWQSLLLRISGAPDPALPTSQLGDSTVRFE